MSVIEASLFILVVSISIFGVFYPKRRAFLILLGAVFFLAGIWRTEYVFRALNEKPLVGKEISADGYVVHESERSAFSHTVLVRIDVCDEKNICSREKIRIAVSQWDEFSYGERVHISCMLSFPKVNVDDGFDQRMFFAKEHIGYSCDKARVERLSGNGGNILYRELFSMRSHLEEALQRALPEPSAGLASGMLFGGSDRLSRETSDMFAKTSMTHIVAVSGYNVSILAYFFLEGSILIGLWRKQAFWFAVFAVVVFVAMIGFPSSAVRAGIMGCIVLAAMQFGRAGNAMNALLLAGSVMLLVNPFLLRYDIGFQLSFLATIGILVAAPFFQRITQRGKFSALSELFFTTVSAQLFVFPLIAYYFHTVSFMGVIANILILWMVPIAMLTSFVTAFFGAVFGGVVAPFAWLTHGLLWYDIEVIRHLASFRFGFVRIDSVPVWAVMIWYVCMAISILSVEKIYRRRCRHHEDDVI